MEHPAPEFTVRGAALLGWCIAASALAHLLMLILLPGWSISRNTQPAPLSVELREPPPEIVPPKPLPIDTQPQPRPKPTPAKPERVKPAPLREETPAEQVRATPVLIAPPEAPPSPAAAVVAEPRALPPPQSTEPPRAQAVPPPLTQPRSDAAYLNNPRPAYPLAARRRGDQGTVLIRVLVTAEGLAATVGLEKTSGHPALDEAALAAVKSWRFVPARQGGQAVEAPYVVPIVFKME